ncbi:hypothetical protein ACJJID_11015 [Microbulbifer sp. CnH-101-G]|uniref:hypothetical protein n=1 Tax=Microbulbifer sp. CnH-101-G TaxID=3243393 RepID=UPI00403924C0
MRRNAFWLLLMLFSASELKAASLAQQWELAVAVNAKSRSESAIFDIESGYERQAKLQGALQLAGWEGQVSVLHDADNGAGEESELIVEEFFWQGGWFDWDLLAGKRRLDYGVSYAHRPLDLFLPMERNPVSLRTNEGVAVVSASRFTASGELSLMLVDANASQLIDEALPKGIAARWYQLEGESEWQLLGYLDDQRGLNIGASWVATYGESWELHSEGRYQQHYRQWLKPDGPEASVSPREGEQSDGWQALLGMTWAHRAGHTVIAEYWFDSRAWHTRDWKKLSENARWYREQGVRWDGIRYASAAAFLSEGRNRHNVMLHWRLSNHNYNPKLDLLYSPDDGGLVVTTGIHREMNSNWTLGASIRYFGGAKQSYFAQLPSDTHVTLTANMNF